jgi:ribonuclease HI
MSLVIFTDGASFGNPGPMGIGVVIYRDGKKAAEMSEYIGNGTNNIAEYTAVMRALEYARESGDKEVHVKSDSQLIVRQLNGDYKVKDEKLKTLKRKIESLIEGMNVRFEHIPREKNEEADALSKEAAETGKKAGKETKRTGQQKLGVFL